MIVCSIENVDPMGVHTGDSVTVAPQQTLTDREYQAMRDDALACLRAIGVETGGSNVQFAVDPDTGRRVLIEMNPRVCRSSALASKATGFPIAKIAAMLAVGYRLDEIRNDITGATPASFEPTLDYVVDQDPAVRLREVPGGRRAAHLDDEVGRRGDGDRADVQGSVREGVARAREAGADLGATYVASAATAPSWRSLRDGTEGRFHLIERALARGSRRRGDRRRVVDRSLVRRSDGAGVRGGGLREARDDALDALGRERTPRGQARRAVGRPDRAR